MIALPRGGAAHRRLLVVAVLMGAAASATAAPGTFRHKRSRVTAALGSPHHSATDLLTFFGNDVVVHGKFSYGRVSKDLEDEVVNVYLKRGSKWHKLGHSITNDDGRATFAIRGTQLEKPGAYRFSFVVAGDRSSASGTVWVLPPSRKVAIFDIDGTLTASDGELVDYIISGNPIAMRRDANRLVWYYTKLGYLPVYLTGRPYLYNAATRAWLHRNKFPHGPLVTTDSIGEALPGTSRVGKFKLGWLANAIADLRLDVKVAFGNASTDVCAFARAGIPPASTYIVGKNAGRACKGFAATKATASFASHLSAVRLH